MDETISSYESNAGELDKESADLEKETVGQDVALPRATVKFTNLYAQLAPPTV
jgi:hypothetical protein